MTENAIAGGTAHRMTPDIRKTLLSRPKARTAWSTLTPLARNEWICWIISVKKAETRKEHIARMLDELAEGTRRPCCWIGCIHRKDKAMSPSVRGILEKKARS